MTSPPSAEPTIRRAHEADIVAIQVLLAETWHATYDGWLGAARVAEIVAHWHDAGMLAEQIAAADAGAAVFLVAETDGVISGTAFGHHLDSGEAEIGRLYVHPTAQGRGLGAALLRYLMTELTPAQRFVLNVDPRNQRAIDFYRRHGFTVAAEARDSGGANSGLAYVGMVREA